MNKQELLEEIVKLDIEVSENFPHYDLVDKEVVLDLIDQLDEPETISQQWIDENKVARIDNLRKMTTSDVVPVEKLKNLLVPKQDKPVIPKFVADWFEKNKDLTFIEAMDELFWDHHDEKMVEFLISEDNEHIRENQELLMKVWLYADYGGNGMKFTKENVIKVFGNYMDFEEDDSMLEHDDFVLEIMNMDDVNDVDVEEEFE